MAEQLISSTDFNPVKALARIENDLDLYVELIKMYLEDAPEMLKDIEPAFLSKNYEVASIRTHSLKSTSRTVGADGLGEFASQAEQAVLKRDWNTALLLLPKIQSSFEQIRIVFNEIAESPEEKIKLYCQ